MATKLSDVLLGLVKLHPGASGYDLRRIVAQSTQYFMNAQLSQIYPALKQMSAAGLMRFDEVKTAGGRRSKRYYLTEAGEGQYLAWLREPVDYSLGLNAQRLFMLKLTFIGSLPREEQADFLQNALDYFRYERSELMAGHLDLENEYLSDTLPERETVMGFWRWELERILTQEEEFIAWIERMLIEVEQGS